MSWHSTSFHGSPPSHGYPAPPPPPPPPAGAAERPRFPPVISRQSPPPGAAPYSLYRPSYPPGRHHHQHHPSTTTGLPPPRYGDMSGASYHDHRYPPSPYGAATARGGFPPLTERRTSPNRESSPRVPLSSSPSSHDAVKSGGCTCKKSRCLKLYCQCFALSSTCGPKCKCQTCHNTPLHAKEIRQARATILERNPGAFDDKFRGVAQPPQPPVYSAMPHQDMYYEHSSPEAAAAGFGPKGGAGSTTNRQQPRVNKFGCKCRRSFCLKKYCECYQNSVPCGLNCRCLNCKNTPSEHGLRLVRVPPSEMPKRWSPSTTTTTTTVPHPLMEQGRCVSVETTSSPSAGSLNERKKEDVSEARMAIMAAVAMTELLGSGLKTTPSKASVSTPIPERKRKAESNSSVVSEEAETEEKKPRVEVTPSPAKENVASRHPSPVSVATTPQHYYPTHHSYTPRHSPPPYHHYPGLPPRSTPPPRPYYAYAPPPGPLPPARVTPSYEDVIKTSGLPKSLSFRKICSKCGKTRAEHGELGFGNKCVFQDCGKCGAGMHVHEKHGSPMGILCRLTVEEGATPGAAAKYERKIRDLAERAEIQKTMQEDKRLRVERLVQNMVVPNTIQQ